MGEGCEESGGGLREMSINILCIPTSVGLSKPITGGQNRFSNIVKQLREKGNNVIVLESRDFMDLNDKKFGKVYYYTDLKIFSRTLSVFRDVNIDFILKVMKILKDEKVDIIQISHPSGIFMVNLITKLMRKEIPIAYDAYDAGSNFIMETFVHDPKYSRLERLTIPVYIRVIEKIVCKYLTDHITSVSEKEAKIFIELYKLKKEKITVIPSGCHILELLDTKFKNNVKEKLGIDSDRLIIFFHGLYSYLNNKEGFEAIENYIAPMFREINEKVLFVMGGTGAPKFERANTKSLGFIEDLNEVLAIVDIAIIPLTKGTGTKLKVLDYLGVGLPTVTTKKGIEGIDAKNYEHAIIVDDINEEFTNAIKYLIDNEQERKRIGANARKLAEEKYDWGKIGEKLDKLYEKILAKKDVKPYDQLGD
ncbi:MAG: glycosyltransferase family 4 protein [Methanobacterium sp.]